MKLIRKIRNFFAPNCPECNEKLIRHHTDLVTGEVYWYCEKCKRKMHF